MPLYGPPITLTDVRREALTQALNEFAIHELARLGLDKIENQTLKELFLSLVRVNKAIESPEYSSRLFFDFDDFTRKWSRVINPQQNREYMSFSFVPTLEGTKQLIEDRIEKLTTAEKLENLAELAKEVPEENIRLKLENEIETLKVNFQLTQNKLDQLEQAQNSRDIGADIEIRKLSEKTTLFERRSKVWLSFLERESVATIAGGILLLIITIALIVAMFIHITPTDILTNSFLVILGYFFGQSVGKGSIYKNKESEP